MVTNVFGILLQELGKQMDNIELVPDSNNSCLIHLKEGINIQLEIDKTGLFLILGADLGEVPPGKYRENLFREALKANDLPHPINGTLAFSKKSEHLVLFDKISIEGLQGEHIATHIQPFTQKAILWAEALKRGDIPISGVSSAQKGSGIFGLR